MTIESLKAKIKGLSGVLKEPITGVRVPSLSDDVILPDPQSGMDFSTGEDFLNLLNQAGANLGETFNEIESAEIIGEDTNRVLSFTGAVGTKG